MKATKRVAAARGHRLHARETEGGAVSRVLGQVSAAGPGPTLVVVAGLHGNEPAGVEAARRFLCGLQAHGGPARGHVVALAGNLGALAAGVRLLDRDLNRAWRRERVARLRLGGRSPGPREDGEQITRLRLDGRSPGPREDSEQVALLAALDAAVAAARGPVRLIDLHTMSGPGPPFVTTGDTLANRALARLVPAPLVLGLEEQVDGTLLEHVTAAGHAAAAVEGGAHRDPRSADHLEAALWCVASGLGLLQPAQGQRATEARQLLRGAVRHMPAVVEMRHRHRVRPGTAFRMRPGFRGFDMVRAGEAVADSAAGPVRVPADGRILMPLYQEQGDDGFFLVREVRPLWLGVSAALRRVRGDRLAPYLPGVRRARRASDAVIIELGLARWWAVEILHLLGYRRRRQVGRALVMTRQPDALTSAEAA